MWRIGDPEQAHAAGQRPRAGSCCLGDPCWMWRLGDPEQAAPAWEIHAACGDPGQTAVAAWRSMLHVEVSSPSAGSCCWAKTQSGLLLLPGDPCCMWMLADPGQTAAAAAWEIHAGCGCYQTQSRLTLLGKDPEQTAAAWEIHAGCGCYQTQSRLLLLPGDPCCMWRLADPEQAAAAWEIHAGCGG
jgi:hypothetical protein